MTENKSPINLFIIFTLIILFLPVLASASETVILFEHPPDPEHKYIIDSSGADSIESFWDLPLYFKLIDIWSSLSSFLTLPNILPLLLAVILCYLGNNNRKKIVSFVSDHPGCLESEILAGLNMKRGTFRYHMDKLLKANLIRSADLGRFTGYFPSDMGENHSVIANDAFLRNDTCRNILDTIFNEPGITGKDLSLKFGLDKSTIHWHVTNLDNSKFIRSEKDGKFKRYYPVKDTHSFPYDN